MKYRERLAMVLRDQWEQNILEVIDGLCRAGSMHWEYGDNGDLGYALEPDTTLKPFAHWAAQLESLAFPADREDVRLSDDE